MTARKFVVKSSGYFDDNRGHLGYNLWAIVPNMKGKHMRKNMYRITEASEYLGLSPTTVRSWVRQGLIPVFRGPSGRQWWSKDLLDEIKNGMLEQGTSNADTDSTPKGVAATICK